MTSFDIFLLVVAVALIPLGGMFAAVDAALENISPARVSQLRKEKVRGAEKLHLVVGNAAPYVSLLLLLRVACELFSTTLVALVTVAEWGIGWRAALVTGGAMTVVSFVLVGVGPRTLGRQHAYTVALRAAGPTRLLGRVLSPLTRLLIAFGNALTPGRGFRQGPFASQVELRELVDLAEARGVVEHGERDMIHSVFELGDTIVREVMVPRTEMVWIERQKTGRQALALALRSGYSRIPVIAENVDDVIGIVYLKDLARRSQDTQGEERSARVEELMRAVTFVPDSKPVDELLREMQAARTHMAVAIDEYGGTAGLVTIEDVLEEIVGEITDEYDVERPPITKLDEFSARVSARLSIEDLAELTGADLPTDEVETVGGLLAEALGRVPIPGAHAIAHALDLTAESAGGRRNRVDTVLVRWTEPDDEAERSPDRANDTTDDTTDDTEKADA